jgi:hypothetical protein
MQTTEYKSGRREQLSLHELKPIPERIVNIKAVEPWQRVIFDQFDFLRAKACAKCGHIEDANSGMRFGSGSEIHLHPDVHLMHAALQPDAATLLQCGGFRELGHPKYFDVKLARSGFTAGWRGKLDMVNAEIEVHLPLA